VLHNSIWGAWSFVWGAKPPNGPHGDWTDLIWDMYMGIRRNFSRGGNVDICLSFSGCWQCKQTFTKYFTLSIPQRKCRMLRQQSHNCASLAAMLLFHWCLFSHSI